MTKPELISAIAEASGLSKSDSSLALDAFISSVTHALSKGENVTLVGFGNFIVKDRAERKGRNPSTGEEMIIKAAKVPAFKIGKSLKEAVNTLN